jgi:hypothetical protein
MAVHPLILKGHSCFTDNRKLNLIGLKQDFDLVKFRGCESSRIPVEDTKLSVILIGSITSDQGLRV